jgi:2-keto-3-deoxy-L-rhamnonate aldolase RhmA
MHRSLREGPRGLRALGLIVALFGASLAQAAQPPTAPLFNTVKQKLAAGKQVVGGTIDVADVDVYCAMATAGFDFLWIEMQHSALTYGQVAMMIRACPGPAIPFIRVPTDSEGDIQKAVDIGALGVIVPMVDTLEKVRNTIRFAKYPPVGARSLGGGQYGTLWGRDYRERANDNVMIVAMVESPAGVQIAGEIAKLDQVDVVFVASTDLGSFTGLRQGDPKYEALVTRVKDATLSAGKVVAGPSAWKGTREGYRFFQGPPVSALIRSGAKLSLEGAAESGAPRGVAPIEGAEH